MGSILFNFYINDLFLFVKKATLHNYADDNTLAYFSKTLSNLIEVLEEEAGFALTWLKQNQMIANPEKLHALLIKKDQTNTSRDNFNIQGKTFKSEETVKLLGIHLDYKLNFEQHISKLCRKAASQLNVLKRLKRFIGFNEKKFLAQSFVYSNFDYCPLVWYFSSAKSLQKIEKFKNVPLDFYTMVTLAHTVTYVRSQKGALCMFPGLRVLCIEVFKTLKNLNPSFMQDIFKIKSSSYSLRKCNDLQHYRPNQVTFGSNSLRSLGPQIWNGLPNEIKSAENLNNFKNMIKKWDGQNCKCSACKYVPPN